MEQTFGIAAFRSRQQVFQFDSALRRSGVHTQVISTPRDIQVGCGLSVRFDLQEKNRVMDVYRRHPPGNLIGFYSYTPSGPRGRIAPL